MQGSRVLEAPVPADGLMAPISSDFSQSPLFMAGGVRAFALPQEKITFFFFFSSPRRDTAANLPRVVSVPLPLPSQEASPRLPGMRARPHARKQRGRSPLRSPEVPGFGKKAARLFRVGRGFGEGGGSEGPARWPAAGSERQAAAGGTGFWGGSLQRAGPPALPLLLGLCCVPALLSDAHGVPAFLQAGQINGGGAFFSSFCFVLCAFFTLSFPGALLRAKRLLQ